MESISRVEQVLLWLGGYSPRALQHEAPEDRQAITKIGAAVLFSTVFAAMNWGLAGWAYSRAFEPGMRLVVAALAALIGALAVILLDRTFIYFLDTTLDGGRFQFAFYGAIRVGIILVIGLITSQAVMPLLLRSELRAEALHMAEDSEKARMSDLSVRYAIPRKEAEIAAVAKEIERLRLAAVSLPSSIQKKLRAAEECWTEYGTQRAILSQRGYSTREVDEELLAKRSHCAERRNSANAEREAYFARTKAQLAQALNDRQLKEKEYAETTQIIKTKVERAAVVESESFNPESSTVLWAMVRHNPGALAKWFLLSTVLLVFELLPFIIKFQAGQSNVGRRIAIDQAIRRFEMSTRLQQRRHDLAISSAVSEVSVEAVREALANGEVRAIFSQAFAANIAAFAPIEAVRSMMRDLEARHVDVSEFMSRFPQLASVIAEAWSRAVRNTSEILARGLSTN